MVCSGFVFRLLSYSITCSTVALVSTHPECPKISCDQIVEHRNCLPWHYSDNSTSHNECKCFGKMDGKYKDIIKQHKKNPPSMLKLGYCMTYSDNTTYLLACPYDIVGEAHSNMLQQQYLKLNTTLGDLNNFTCSQLNRYGKHCARCMKGYGQSIFTLDLSCFSCSKLYRGWGLYLFFELVPLTCFMVLILVLQLSPTKPNMKAFVLFAQLITLLLSLPNEQQYKYIYGSKTFYLISIIKTCYGFWNLDFFRSWIPSFCVSDDLNNLEVMAFHYITVVYPIMLTVVAWIIVDLHERGCGPLVKMWKPFRRYLSHYSVTSNPKSMIASFFATVVILSYTKVIYISANLLDQVNEYRICAHSYNRVLFLQPDINNFSPQHLPFVFLSMIMLLAFVVVPLLILLLYPIKSIQDGLKNFCVRHNNIQMFAETFYGCYHDGSDEKRDCRLFSTLYLFLRIFVVLIFVKSERSLTAYLLVAVIHGIIIGLFCVYKPYKKEAYNYLDFFFFTCFGIALLFAGFATNGLDDETNSRIIFSVIFLIVFTPFLYAMIRVSSVLIKWLKLINIRSIIQQRRRGYAEIGEYGIEPEVSVSDTEQNHHEQGRRTRGKDSLQSE